MLTPFTDRWNVFTTALGSHRYVVADIAKLALLAAAAVYLYWFGRRMTPYEVALTVAAVLLVLFFWVVLEYALKLTRQISDARLSLAALRADGVTLRNCHGAVTDKASFEAWAKKVNAWRDTVQRELEKISKSDAAWFSVLDVVPPARIPPPQWHSSRKDWSAFAKLYGEHDCRLARLGDMIRELWGKR
jgi:hypothetical protein